jgi:hypothetical protein
MLQILLQETLGEVLATPLWWYGRGAERALERFRDRLRAGDDYLGWSVWAANLFTPMYAQADFAGRLISLAARSVQLLARSLLLLAWVTVATVLLVLYFAVPVIAVAQVIYHWPQR